MRYRIFTRSVATLLLLAMQLPAVARAHDGSARIELSMQQTSSGAELEIRGVNIAPEQPITLVLAGAGADFPLGIVMGDAHGDFAQAVTIPREAPAGAYNVRAFGQNRVVVAAPLRLIGVAQEEGGEQRDQGEPLLAPMPPPQEAFVAPTPLEVRVEAPASVYGSSASPPASGWIVVPGIALAVVACLAFFMRRRVIR